MQRIIKVSGFIEVRVRTMPIGKLRELLAQLPGHLITRTNDDDASGNIHVHEPREDGLWGRQVATIDIVGERILWHPAAVSAPAPETRVKRASTSP